MGRRSLGNVVPLTRAISWLVSPSLSSLQLLAAWLDPAPQPSAPKHLVSALQQTAQVGVFSDIGCRLLELFLHTPVSLITYCNKAVAHTSACITACLNNMQRLTLTLVEKTKQVCIRACNACWRTITNSACMK
jgi:hypothetical protein